MRLLWPCVTVAALAVAGCGRTPIVQPCAERIDGEAVLTCDPAQQCEAPSFFITNRPANALVVLDRSCSMASLVDGRSKWARAVEAVTDVVAQPRANLRWGLSLFPQPGADACVQGPIAVPVGAGQEPQIQRTLTRALDRDDRYYPGEPCGTNLAGATQQLLDDQPFEGRDGRDHVVLITDGRHAGCSGSGDDAVDDVDALRQRDIRTVVIGFGGGEDTRVLQALGEAGGVPASAELAYHLAGLDELDEVLQEVVAGLGCRHPLTIDAELSQVRVSFDDDQVVPRDFGPGDGWQYRDETLWLTGQWCEQLLRGEVELIEVALDCG
ncbi:MAG: VWA domain-containing protein [Nannocystaceae bacterium]